MPVYPVSDRKIRPTDLRCSCWAKAETAHPWFVRFLRATAPSSRCVVYVCLPDWGNNLAAIVAAGRPILGTPGGGFHLLVPKGFHLVGWRRWS